MQHLNYCRQALAQFSDERLSINAHFNNLCDEYPPWAGNDNMVKSKHDVTSIMEQAIKFVLPKNGATIEDKKYKGIQSLGELKLPFDEFILEFETDRAATTVTGPSKVIIILAKFTDPPDKIAVLYIVYIPEVQRWLINPPLVVETKAYEDSSGGLAVALQNVESGGVMRFYTQELGAFGVMMEPVLNFLNALACRNVHIEKSPARATKQGKKVKAALPFDDYHYLTVDVPGRANSRINALGGSHRAPREHLRRGHIRRLESGSIWVNACVVNAGIGSKVEKSYLVRRAQ